MLSKVLTVFLLMAFSAISWAGCTGSDSYYSCRDSSGNHYRVSKMGSTTTVYGTNSSGQTWSSRSSTYGNTTYQTGISADGGSWNQTITNSGYGTSIRGTDSDGNPYSTYRSNY